MITIAAQNQMQHSPAVQSQPGPARQPSVTVVCCVESGPLETTTVMMVQSLRRWGGRFADIPVIAVTPRSGPPLMRSTHRQLDKLNVNYIRRHQTNVYSWYSFLNKPLSLMIGEEFAKTDHMVWLDADVLVTGQPDGFELPAGVDFAGCPSDRNVGSLGPQDKHDAYWSRMCRTLKLDMNEVPWVQTCREKARIRFYMNGGVLVYRIGSGYGRQYLKGCLDVLDARVSSRDSALFFAEQVTAGLVAVKNRLKCEILAEQFNYAVGSKALDGFDVQAFAQARVLHYHDALWGHFYPQFMELCRTGQPALHDWLKETGPLTNLAPLPWRIWTKAIKRSRASKERKFIASCDQV